MEGTKMNLPILCMPCTDKCTQERHNLMFIALLIIAPVILGFLVVIKLIKSN